MAISNIDHRGKKILYVDYRGLDHDGRIEQLEQLAALCERSAGKLAWLADLEGVPLDHDFVARAKELGRTRLERRTRRSATVGVTGLEGVLLRGYAAVAGSTVRPFADRWAALDYLAG
jgi:hypothetical protein